MRPADLSHAAAMACRVLLARRVDTLPVDPLSLLQACRDTRVYTQDAAADLLNMPRAQIDALFADADAVMYRMPAEESSQYAVIYRRDGHPARLRFTLAHELGHRIMNHTGDDPADEREADCFASHLLCPEPVLRALAKDGGADAAEWIASVCYVSYSCARVALRRPAVVVDPALRADVEELLAPALEHCKNTRQKAE